MEGKKWGTFTMLLPFPITYVYEAGFSSFISTKTTYQNRLNIQVDISIELSSIKPDIKEISKNVKPMSVFSLNDFGKYS